MIEVLVKRSGDCVEFLHVEGHAQPGKLRGGRYDLVCAAVSALMGNLLEGFDLLGKNDRAAVNEKDNSVRVTPEDDFGQQLLVKTTIRSLAGVESQYGKFLEIHTMEV